MRYPTIDEMKMFFGFLLLVIVAFICVAIALGKVEEQTSFGLTQIITVLASLAGGFAQWAFSNGRPKNNESKDQNSPSESGNREVSK